MLTTLFLIISYFAIGIYSILIAQLAMVWNELKKSTYGNSQQKSISIVIVFRNEEKNLKKIISQLLGQQNVQAPFEILLVDDHSTDNGYKVVHSIVKQEKNIHLLQLEKGVDGKKNGLQLGIGKSQFPWIATLDADVEISSEWLQSLQSTSDADMHILPVIIKSNHTLFGKIQALEFLSLVGTTASMCKMKIPVLCNGANLLFTKEIYLKTLPLRKDFDISSGDDMFLMHEVKKIGDIEWVHDLKALAKTNPCDNISDFIQQRIRWANKSKHYTDTATKVLGIIVLIVNLNFVISGIGSFFYDEFRTNFLITLFAKTIVDFILISRVAGWFNMRHLLKYYFLIAILYPVYAIGIPVAGMISKPLWKGRKIEQ